MKHILLVDDDALMRRSLAFNLEKAGYRTSTAANAEDALNLARRDPPDLVLLDIGLPGMDGLEALKQFQQGFQLPVILVTARRRELDEILGLELGADDYVTKPFDIDVLVAHIKSVLRRVQRGDTVQEGPEVIRADDFHLDPSAHTLTLKGKEVELSPKEFDLLYELALHAGKVVSADDLLAAVWGAEFNGQPQVLYVHIRWLRQKLEDDPDRPRRILTVRGVGYKFLIESATEDSGAPSSGEE